MQATLQILTTHYHCVRADNTNFLLNECHFAFKLLPSLVKSAEFHNCYSTIP